MIKPRPTTPHVEDEAAARMPMVVRDGAEIPFHPLADIFPLIEGVAFRELVEDIRAHGLRDAIVLHEGMILDGRNRYRACQAAQVAARFETYDGKDPLGFVISKNLHRRHLDESQRAMVGARLATMRKGARTDLAPIGAKSDAEVAKLLHVGERSIERAKTVQRQGSAGLARAVDEGRVKVSTAVEIAKLPKPEQERILADAKLIRSARADIRRAERIGRIAEIAKGNGPLKTEQKFPVLYMDPPTKFAAGDSDRSAENHYPTMTEEEIAALPVSDLATPDAVIFMWTTVPWLRKSIRLLEGWGFDYVSAAFWDKEVAGKGFWWRNQTEVLLTATRGNMPAPPPELVLPGYHSARKTDHSSKPEWFRWTIGRYYPDLPKIELFARGTAPEGWTFWGNQAQAKTAEPQPEEARGSVQADPLHADGQAAATSLRDDLEIPKFLKREATAGAVA